jgi:hypothetical protein
MTSITAHVPTAYASLYLQKLSKHWAHRLDVAFDAANARIAFAADKICNMAADREGLDLVLTAPELPEAKRLAGVVFDHLKRMANHDALEQPVWTPFTA